MIYVNARFLTQRITGVQRFALEISRQLQKLRDDIIFVTPCNVVNKKEAGELKAVVLGSSKGHFWEQVTLPYMLKKQNSPLLLNLANTAPLIYSNQVVTIHDIAFKINPKWFSKAFSTYYNFLIPQVAKSARKVITVSDSSKKDLCNAFSLGYTKVEVIYNAVSSDFQNAVQKEQIRFNSPYIMAVGSVDPRKNINKLLEAFSQIKDKETQLLLIGGQNKSFANAYTSTQNDRVIRLGYVADPELAALYNAAEAFLYPSLYEGFGLPNIEAMHFGCPVITSDIAACREVCGEAALYVNPYDVNDIASKIDTLLSDKQLKEKLKDLGQEQSKKYSWDNSARQLSLLLDELITKN